MDFFLCYACFFCVFFSVAFSFGFAAQANLNTNPLDVWYIRLCGAYRCSANMYNQRAMDRAISDMSLKYYLYTATNTIVRNENGSIIAISLTLWLSCALSSMWLPNSRIIGIYKTVCSKFQACTLFRCAFARVCVHLNRINVTAINDPKTICSCYAKILLCSFFFSLICEFAFFCLSPSICEFSRPFWLVIVFRHTWISSQTLKLAVQFVSIKLAFSIAFQIHLYWKHAPM